ncbi:cupin domain-containing protein [Streptomyces sp. DH12]|uniref:cupin domain-containing protein n=1 Tax=Streptomyces sp. DH12 TaxID=2857010 RepID=UPI001E460319|nr:cupin domain-containing protein [Streptomyces sp. DH12]
MTVSPAAAVLARMADLVRAMPAERGGTLWRLAAADRQLDANVVRLAPGAGVAVHVEPDLDVLVFVVNGHGELSTGDGTEPLEAGAVVWLPRGSRRGLTAGPHGLDYLTAHRRRPGMTIGRAAGVERSGGEPACLLDRVCPECGRLAPEGADVRFCGRCGHRLPEG